MVPSGVGILITQVVEHANEKLHENQNNDQDRKKILPHRFHFAFIH